MVTALRYSVVMPLQWVLLLHLYKRKVLLIVWMVTNKRIMTFVWSNMI